MLRNEYVFSTAFPSSDFATISSAAPIASSDSRKWINIKSDVEPISRTKHDQPASPGFPLVDFVFVDRLGLSRSTASATRLVRRPARGLPSVKRKIWCNAYQPSSVSGGCAIIDVVMH